MESVTINYRTHKEYCKCCEQELPEAKSSNIKDFTFHKERVISWCDWESSINSPDDFYNDVFEFVTETIHFFAEDSDSRLIINGRELNKVENYIKEIVEN